MTRAASPVQTLTALFDAQRMALLSGDLAALDGMDRRLSEALERLGRTPPSPVELAEIATLAARNARLLDAARAGVARARNRPRKATSATLTTYDAQGHRMGTGATGQTLSRR